MLLAAVLSGVYETDGMIYGWRVTALSPRAAPPARPNRPGGAAPQRGRAVRIIHGFMLLTRAAPIY